MTGRRRRCGIEPRRAARFALGFLVLACAAPACTDETVPFIEIGPTGKVAIKLDSPVAGTCFGITHCGHVKLTVNGIDNNVGATNVVDVLLRKLANRYTDLTLTVTLLNDLGEPWTGGLDGGATFDVVTASVAITTKESCN